MIMEKFAVGLLQQFVAYLNEERERHARSVAAGEALFLEVSHNLVVLRAVELERGNSAVGAYVDVARCLRIDAHAEFLRQSLGRDAEVSVKHPKAKQKAVSAALREKVDELVVTASEFDEDPWFRPVPQQHAPAGPREGRQWSVGLTQAIAFVVSNVSAMQAIAAHHDAVDPVLVNLRGGVRLRNLRAVEDSLRVHFQKQIPALQPRAGLVEPQEKIRTRPSKSRVSP